MFIHTNIHIHTHTQTHTHISIYIYIELSAYRMLSYDLNAFKSTINMELQEKEAENVKTYRKSVWKEPSVKKLRVLSKQISCML